MNRKPTSLTSRVQAAAVVFFLGALACAAQVAAGGAGGPPAVPTAEELTQINTQLRTILSDDAAAKAVLEKYPSYAPLAAAPAGGRGAAGGRGGAAGGRGGRGGAPLTADDRKTIDDNMQKLAAQISDLKTKYAANPKLYDRIADVEVYLNAVKFTLEDMGLPNPYNANGGFPNLSLAQATTALNNGMERATELAAGQTPWMSENGLRGYYSKIDGTAEPYLLNLPVGYNPDTTQKYRLDIFNHGRGDTSTEMGFIGKNVNSATAFNQEPTHPDATRFILQPWGRWCNATRFAGEVDVLEAMGSVMKAYPIDENRIVETGFSMGGASGWLFATHLPDLWVAGSPGAGFTETTTFLRIRPNAMPPEYQQTLWHMYDSVDYALNAFDTHVVAYSSDVDPQKQAADAMQAAMEKVGLPLEYIIGHGANPAHSYTQDARQQIMARLDQIATAGRDPSPKEVRFTTWMLRYNKAYWLTLDGMEQEWQRAQAEGKIDGDKLAMTTSNVNALHLTWTPGLAPWAAGTKPALTIDGTDIALPAVAADKSLNVGLVKNGGKWQIGELPAGELHKVHDLQGPIDDAFMDSFMIVKPTGTALNAAVGKWTTAEADRAIQDWQISFRGDARVKNDKDITDADIAANNLVLFGDPSSNAILKRIADKLPIKWTAQGVVVGDKTYDSAWAVPVMIYPNPLNPKKYVVLNSGFTFHDLDNNDKMAPKLPDWAVVDITKPGDINLPTAAVGPVGFFDEQWKLKTQ